MTGKLDCEQLLLIGEETGEDEEDEADEVAIEVQYDDEKHVESYENSCN